MCEYSRSRSFHYDLILQDQASGERSQDQWSSGVSFGEAGQVQYPKRDELSKLDGNSHVSSLYLQRKTFKLLGFVEFVTALWCSGCSK